jgi:hypothetical protein
VATLSLVDQRAGGWERWGSPPEAGRWERWGSHAALLRTLLLVMVVLLLLQTPTLPRRQ